MCHIAASPFGHNGRAGLNYKECPHVDSTPQSQATLVGDDIPTSPLLSATSGAALAGTAASAYGYYTINGIKNDR